MPKFARTFEASPATIYIDGGIFLILLLMQKVSFRTDSNAFYASLRHDVDAYFEKQQISKNGNFYLYLKTVIFMLASVVLYGWLVFFTPASPLLALLLCVLTGMNTAFIGFNVMHDASHGSYSANARVCHWMSYTMNYLGSNVFFWNTKHNILHHTYTNIDGMDSDIVQTKLLRLAPTQTWRPIHRFQSVYATFLYAVSHATWLFFNDFEKYFSQKVMNMPIRGFDRQQHIIFWVTKILYAFMYVVVPVWLLGAKALIGLVVFSAAAGITLTVVFQLAHVVEITDFEDGTEDIVLENEWAIHQINTTADFATNNKIISWFLGGLNFQVEHHLFPKISHVHYPALQKIVQKKCAEFGIAHRSFPTMWAAIRSHYRMLHTMGNTREEAIIRHKYDEVMC
jgi:linoleoyl-CoA desaturase